MEEKEVEEEVPKEMEGDGEDVPSCRNFSSEPTDYMFLTLRPADLILSVATESDLLCLLSSPLLFLSSRFDGRRTSH